MNNDRFCHRGVKSLPLLIAIVLWAGCARTPPISYYQLSIRPDAAALPAPSANGQSLVVGLGPVQLPEYLERLQIVRRSSANHLQVTAAQRWAEPLSAGLPRVLGEDLALLLGDGRVLHHPWGRSRLIDRQVCLEILQFEGGQDGAAVLSARWSVLDANGKMLLAERRSDFKVEAAPGTEAMVAALSDALWRLAGEIAISFAGPD